MPKFTDEELALLTDEEREGLEDDSLVDDPIEDDGASGAEAAAAAEPAKEPAVEPAKVAEPVKPEPEAAAAVAQDPATPKAAEPAKEPAADAVPAARRTAPPPAYKAPADVDQQIGATRQAMRDLAAKFDAGDISAAEYETERQQLDDKVFDLRMARERAGQSFDAQKHHFLNEAVPTFLDQHKEYGENETLYNALDEQVRILQVTEYKGDAFNPKIIEDAHAKLNAIRGIAPAAPANGNGAAPKKPDGQREIPPSLGSMPTAGEDNMLGDGGRFAHLDRLTGLDYETALAALSASDRERYLAQ